MNEWTATHFPMLLEEVLINKQTLYLEETAATKTLSLHFFIFRSSATVAEIGDSSGDHPHGRSPVLPEASTKAVKCRNAFIAAGFATLYIPSFSDLTDFCGCYNSRGQLGERSRLRPEMSVPQMP